VVKRVLAMFVVSFLLAAFGAAGVTAAGAATSSAGEYAEALCTNLTSWQQEISDGEATVQADLQNAQSVSEVKTTFVQFLDDAVASGKVVVSELKAAGAPDVKDGAAVATTVRTAFAGIVKVFESARSDAKKLSTTDDSKFTAGVTKIQKSLDAASQKFGKAFTAAGKKYDTKELDTAFNAEPACSQLS
jgi:hypothetical protein